MMRNTKKCKENVNDLYYISDGIENIKTHR